MSKALLTLNGVVYDTLIGHTGFVGGTLDRAHDFAHRFNSKNAEDMRGLTASGVVCAGVYAEKWRANAEPENDLAHVRQVFDLLSSIKTDNVVLISTVDLYDPPVERDETFEPDLATTHPYGRHRLMLEHWVRDRFPNTIILRLPGLFGPGLKKNVIFDLIQRHRLEFIHPDGQLQWLDITRVPALLGTMAEKGIDRLNAVTEPLLTSELRDLILPGADIGGSAPPKAPRYDLRTLYGEAMGGQGGYIQSRAEVLHDLAAYAGSAR